MAYQHNGIRIPSDHIRHRSSRSASAAALIAGLAGLLGIGSLVLLRPSPSASTAIAVLASSAFVWAIAYFAVFSIKRAVARACTTQTEEAANLLAHLMVLSQENAALANDTVLFRSALSRQALEIHVLNGHHTELRLRFDEQQLLLRRQAKSSADALRRVKSIQYILRMAPEEEPFPSAYAGVDEVASGRRRLRLIRDDQS
ncbi:hypothetical protein [Glycomyces paridis]|uniref:Uncharacterized protein n=1 Tax=Glycomyces paridis TaxID=2126555 RepID=A0A4S8PP71_9ACTN|nr:hypothetical protein [Glycomyces paridis]THV30134.1 hypothetical protein E9998_07085 [Glycomyces paridis]